MNNSELPPLDKLIPTLQCLLRNNRSPGIANKLEGADCYYNFSDIETPYYSPKQGCELNLLVSGEYLNYLDRKDIKSEIRRYANRILEKKCPYEFVEINVSPKLISKPMKKVFDSDIKNSNILFTGDERHSIPEDIINNSKEMSQVYQYVYIIENVLRHYINEKCLSAFGENYLEKMEPLAPIQKKLHDRSNNDKKNIWMGSKRESQLYLLDLLDLNKIIEGKWELFETDFPSKEWIKTQINEINECRKLIAHNNISIENHSKDVLITSSKSILKQLKYLE